MIEVSHRKHLSPILSINTLNSEQLLGARVMPQVLPSRCKVLNSNSNTAREREREKGQGEKESLTTEKMVCNQDCVLIHVLLIASYGISRHYGQRKDCNVLSMNTGLDIVTCWFKVLCADVESP
jgi:hypothetical protein